MASSYSEEEKAYLLKIGDRIREFRTMTVRFVFVKIDSANNSIASIIILTPGYIEEHFGKFGKPTIKQQLLISSKVRKSIIDGRRKIL